MKKIMKVKPHKYDPKVVYFDVSTKKLLDTANKWMFQNTYMLGSMEEEISDWKNDLRQVKFVENCDLCDKTGKVIIKNKEIGCPECNGISNKNYYDKEWIDTIKLFNRAKSGNMKAINEFIKEVGPLHFEDWEIINISKCK